MKNKLKAFTLIELITVMIIVSILAVMGFVYFKTYPIEARDSLRYNDIRENIPNALELYKSANGEYPLPSNLTNTGYVDEYGIEWLDGTFGEEMLTKIEGLEKLPKDPKLNEEYRYLLSKDGKYYKLITILETTKEDLEVSNSANMGLTLTSETIESDVGKTCTGVVLYGEIIEMYNGEKIRVYSKANLLYTDAGTCDDFKGLIECSNGTLIGDNTSIFKYTTCEKEDSITSISNDCLPGSLDIGGHIYDYTVTIIDGSSDLLKIDGITISSLNGTQSCEVNVKCEDGNLKQEGTENCIMESCDTGFTLIGGECKKIIICETEEHLEGEICVNNEKEIDCIETGGPTDESTFTYNPKTTIYYVSGSWEEIPDCSWECNSGLVKDEVNNECLSYCDFGGTDNFDGCIMGD